MKRGWLAGATLSVALLAGIAAGTQAPAGDGALLPPDGFAPGWARSGPQRVFASADLYGHINGGAEAFLELGFERLTVQRFGGSGGSLAIELYRMADAAAARGIYLARGGRESSDPALTARHTANQYQLLLQRERFFLVVSNLAGGGATAGIMTRAAAAIVDRLPADVPVKVLALLPAADLVEGSQRILRGPFGLQAIYTLGDGDMLRLGGRVTAVAGTYRRQTAGAYTLIVALYPDGPAARRAFDHIRTNLDPLIKRLRGRDTSLVFQDHQEKFGMVSVDGARLEIRIGLDRPPA